MGRLDTELGPMLRVYEFDRYNGTTWQVDMLLYDGAFIAHPRITNPTDVDLRGYWWTCVAVESLPSTRIFAPATHVAETSRDPMRNAPWPYFAEAIENASFAGYQDKWMTDNSYIGNHQIGDMFLRIPAPGSTATAPPTPYIAHNQEGEDGYTLVHGHPLNGTKFYTWGQSGPGRFMQDFLAGGGKRQGDYTELQVGPAPTQMQNFAVPKQSVIEWTEWFKGFKANDKIIRGEDYTAALNSINTWIAGTDGINKDKTKTLNSFFEKYASVPVNEILVQGQPWGALEERLLGKKLAPGLTFMLPNDKNSLVYKEMQPWLELLDSGVFSTETLSKLPLSYQTTDRWLSVLSQSQTKQGMTWLHALYLGIALTERGAITQPTELFQESVTLKPNPIALRCLAVLQTDAESSWSYYTQAWGVLHRDWKNDVDAYTRVTRNLITEMSFFLQQEQWWDRASWFIDQVNGGGYANGIELDAFTTLQIKVKLQQAKYDDAMTMLSSNCFPTYAKARDDLMAMWNTAVEGKAGATSILARHQARMQTRIPDNIGCQYASEYCNNYW